VFFTGTVLIALVNQTSNWDALAEQLGVWVTVHGLLMVLAGVAFGVAVIRAGVLPRWTGVALIAGGMLIALSSGMPDVARTAAAGIRDLGFAGMGVALLTGHRRTPSPAGAADRDVARAHPHSAPTVEAQPTG
jgi:hypothetical protein